VTCTTKQVSKNKRLSLSLIWLFALVLACNRTAPVNLTSLVNKIQPAVVTIVTFDMNNKALGQGSGFFINKEGYLITNHHVLEGANRAIVKTQDGKECPIRLVVAEDEAVDLVKVLVDISDYSVHFVNVKTAVPDIAEKIIVVGSPMGLDQTVSEGIISGFRKITNAVKVLQISAPIAPGSSGSPVVNMKGEVIGVVTSYLTKGQNLNFAVPGEYVLALTNRESGTTISNWTRSTIGKNGRDRSEKDRYQEEKTKLVETRKNLDRKKRLLEQEYAEAKRYFDRKNRELDSDREAIENTNKAHKEMRGHVSAEFFNQNLYKIKVLIASHNAKVKALNDENSACYDRLRRKKEALDAEIVDYKFKRVEIERSR
jgi:hypothetical protein